MDVEDGQEVRPHHYIRSILPGGPIGINAVLKSGDELLEVCYESSMYGTFFENCSYLLHIRKIIPVTEKNFYKFKAEG